MPFWRGCLRRWALAVVDNCGSGSSCCHCLRNYYNQKIRDNLDRKKAAEAAAPAHHL